MDIRRFHATFFEESREGLDAMESGLLAIEAGTQNADTIHTVFRAAHSIKGGAATFGFTAIAELTHHLETLLERARAGAALDAHATGTLLASTDMLRSLFDATEHGQAFDQDALARISAALHALVSGAAAPAAAAAPVAAPAPAAPAVSGWQIGITPAAELFATGNDPLRLLRDLAALGTLDVQVSDDALPAFEALDPHQSFLRWSVHLAGDAKRAAIDDVFAWVDDVCAVTVEADAPAAPTPESAAAPAAAPVASAPVPVAEPQAPAGDASAHAARASDHDGSIRVSTGKVDALVNLVGELVITQAMLAQRSEGLDPVLHEQLLAGLAQLERNSRDLQDAVMRVRMLPVEFAFSRLPRMVRDVASRLGKQARLRTTGENTELDKGVIEKIVDPLVHLVRNAVDHGLEGPEERIAAGKDPVGTVNLSAAHQGGHIVIEICDDGRGLNRERILAKAAERGIFVPDQPSDAQVWDLVFAPGFSTAEVVSDLSGRGVGMDVVRKNIAALGGVVEIASRAGRGSTITIRLPLTLAILDGMTVAVGEEVFVLPLNAVIESLQPQENQVRTIAQGGRLLRVRDEWLPLLDLAAAYGLPGAAANSAPGERAAIAVVVESERGPIALEVDDLLGQQQVVIKNLEANYRRVPGVSGATILGDGRVALIVDPAGLARHAPAAAAA